MGKKTVDEAIKDFYEEPKQLDASKEDNSTDLNDEIDLKIVVGHDDIERTGLIASAQPITHEAGDIVIDFDVEEIPQEASQSSRTSVFAGWMRGRK